MPAHVSTLGRSRARGPRNESGRFLDEGSFLSMKAALAAAAALVLLALIWLYSPRGEACRRRMAAPSAKRRPPRRAGLAGFKSDAWFLPDDELLGFVEVPAGPFLMGSEAGDTLAFDNERWAGSDRANAGAQQAVDVPAFYIGRYEVTVAQFRAFVEATDRPVGAETLQAPGNHPVTSVTWADALAYARWLEGKLKEWEGTPAALKQMLADGGRVTLPSEIEWEKAARGTDGRIYPWGNELRTSGANFQGTRTVPVGSIPCADCAFGLSDMSGNVWEWTRTPFADRRTVPPKRLPTSPRTRSG